MREADARAVLLARAFEEADAEGRLLSTHERARATAHAREATAGAAGLDRHATCQAEARRLRARGVTRLSAPSAALLAGGAGGQIVEEGPREGPPRDGRVIVIFGAPGPLVGWVVADA